RIGIAIDLRVCHGFSDLAPQGLRQPVGVFHRVELDQTFRAMSAYTVVPAEGLVKLDAKETPSRLPETLRREIGEAVADAEINRYPDPTAPALMKRLREVMGIGPEYDILLGNGSDEIIHIIAQSVARPGAVVL